MVGRPPVAIGSLTLLPAWSRVLSSQPKTLRLGCNASLFPSAVARTSLSSAKGRQM